MLCDICKEKESKYTCPKCNSKYCSLVCFKSEKHQKLDKTRSEEQSAKIEEIVETTDAVTDSPKKDETIESEAVIEDPLLVELSKNPQFQNYITSPVLQFHILTVLEILNNVSLTNEYSRDGRLEIASRKLNNLRLGGSEENEYVEEFVTWILNWMEEFNSRNN